MPRPSPNVTGQHFGRLVAIEPARGNGRARWLCRCDCGKEKIVYAKYLLAGDTRSCGCLEHDRRDVYGRFINKVCPEPNSGCWLWTGKVDKCGYGYLTSGKAPGKRAHRLSWELFNGKLTSKDVVCHKCDTPSCVNPLHLFVGTQRDNVLDMWAKKRGHNGERTGSHKLTATEAKSIFESTEPQYVLARRYDIDPSTVSNIKRKRYWRQIHE